MQIHWSVHPQQARIESGKSQLEALALRAGDRLTAAVLDVEKGHDALLSFGKFKAYARMPVPVVSGQNVQIRVESDGQALRMVMVPKGGQAGRGLPDESLALRLFEPVSDQLTMEAHASRLKAGGALAGRITGFEKDGQTLVDFGNFKAFAKIDPPVRQGQTVSLVVVQSGKEVHLAVTDPPQSAGSGGLAATAGPLDPVKASSTPVLPQLEAPPDPAISAAGRSATASPVAPPDSQEIAGLRDQVKQLLDIPPRPGQPTDIVDRFVPLKKALANLQQILHPISPGGDLPAVVARVRTFVENSGIYFEKRVEQEIQSIQGRSGRLSPAELAAHPHIRNLMVRDMKPNLLILNNFIDSQNLNIQRADRHMLETMKSVVQRALTHIEQQQVGATEKPVDPDVLQSFSHLLLLTEEKTNAHLKVYYARKGKAGDRKNPRVSLLLEMDPLGSVRSDLWMVANDLNITFFVPSVDVQTRIQNEQHHIAEALQPPFNTVAVNVVVNAQKIEDFEGDDLSHFPKRQLDVSV